MLCLFTPQKVPAQTQAEGWAISGKVSDNKGEPVIGANIIEDGSQNGTITDVDGNFTMSVKPQAKIKIHYVGYKEQILTVAKDQAVLKIVLKEDVQALNEVVVTGFGLSQKKETLTGAISSVRSKDISRSSAATTGEAIAGKIAGVNFRQQDSRPGSESAIQIRNMGTPLYVIDGVQKDKAQFNNIDFNDIESISILKDASAAIYGVRAANGVVVVTTKRGKRNEKNTITFNGRYGWQDASRLPEATDAVTYVENYIQSETLQGVDDKNRTYSREDLEKWRQQTEKGYRPFDWGDFIWKTSPQYYASLSASGGSDKINYYISLSHLNQEAMIRNYGGMKRYNVQFNVEAQITPKLKIGAMMNGRIKELRNPGIAGGDDYVQPLVGSYRNLPTIRPYANDNPNYPALTNADYTQNFALLNENISGKARNMSRIAQLNASVEYEIIKGLKARGLFGYYYANRLFNNQEYDYDVYGYDEATDTYPVVTSRTSHWLERRVSSEEELTSNIQLSYNKKIKGHKVAAVVGFEAIKNDSPSHWVHSVPASNALHLFDYQTIDQFTDTGNNTKARLGWLGRFNYDYQNKYLAEFSARYDGSWKFPPNHRWGFFPAGSIGWRISEEKFWRNTKILDKVFSDLKLRASFGLVGDDEVDGYAAFDYMEGYNYLQGGGVLDGKYIVGSTPRSLPVTTLSWIKARITDIGLDANFLNNKLAFTFDFFLRKKTGLPAARYDVLLPSEVGFTLPQENLNSNKQQGYDMSLLWSDKISAVKYSVGGNVTFSRLYSWEQYNPKFSNSWDYYRNSKWHRYGNLGWGLVADGQFKNWEEIASWPVDNDRKGNTTLRPGDIKYVDQNGDKVINDLDQRPIGYQRDGTPNLNYGININVAWKEFDLGMDFTGSFMSTWYQEALQQIPFNNGGSNPKYYMGDTWRLSDIFDASSELIPGKYPTLLVGNGTHSNYWYNSFWNTNVKYIKLRNLTLGYSLPHFLLQKVQISKARVYVSGQNLFTLANVPVDPEISASNGANYPTARIVNVGLTLNF